MTRTERLAAAHAKIEAAAPELRATALRLLAGVDRSKIGWHTAYCNAAALVMGQAYACWQADGRRGWGHKKAAFILVDNCINVLAGGQRAYEDMSYERQFAGLDFVQKMLAA